MLLFNSFVSENLLVGFCRSPAQSDQEPELCCVHSAVVFLSSPRCFVGTGTWRHGVQWIALISQRDADRYSPTVSSFILLL